MKNRQSVELDVRPIPVWQRHPKIFDIFDNLEIGAELRIVSDHEPRPLRAELERTRTGRYVWLQRMLNSDHWEVTLRHVTAPHTEDTSTFLRRCALFADASAATHKALADAAIEKTFERNESVAEQGVEWGGFGVVEQGTLTAVMSSPLGREHALFEVLLAEAFGEIATIDGGAMVARFVVTSRCARVLLIPRAVMRAALDSDLALSRGMNDLCAQRLRVVIERFAAQTSLPTVARVAAALLPHAGPQPGLHPLLPSFQNVTQVELATSAGTVKEVVSRALAELEAADAIERSAGHITKADRGKLTVFASRL